MVLDALIKIKNEQGMVAGLASSGSVAMFSIVFVVVCFVRCRLSRD
jgi:hypothetical protein